MPDPHGPRAAAHALILAVLAERRSLSELADTRTAALDAPDRARAVRLAAAGFRHASRADAVLRPHLRKPPPEPVAWALRLGTVEMAALGAPAHGVIDTMVAVVRDTAPRLAGLTNAVLRRVAATLPDAWDAAPPPRLPGWLRGSLQNAHGHAVTVAIEAALQHAPPLDLTLRGPCPPGLEGRHLPTGTLRLPPGGQVSALPGYDTGAWWVQDAAAALPARWRADQPRVLDLCAAPGGKTLQLAAAGAQVTALDASARRMDRLRTNLARTGLAATPVVADALDWRPAAPFPAILLDAPCTATGTLRRHPELPHIRDRSALAGLRALQAQLLDRALDPTAGLIVPGGLVVYCTCSLLPSEGEDQVAAACTRHGARLLARPLPGVPDDWQAADGSLRTRPDQWPEAGGLDGFYMALLRAPQ